MRGLRLALPLVLVLGAGCAGPLVEVEGGFRNREQGYAIGRPGGPGGDWERVEVEGVLLAFRRGPGDALSMQSRCGRPVASAELMARLLLIGVRERELVAAGPVAVDGRGAWAQSFDAKSDGVPLRVKTVTLVADRCAFDWVLVTRGPVEPAEAAFDAWWQSFRLDPERWVEVAG